VAQHLAKKVNFKDSHSNVMNALHLKAKDMRDCIQNLEERDIINVINEAPPYGRGKPARIYELTNRQMLKL
jgi:predicted ArsR family transcriptional regulator